MSCTQSDPDSFPDKNNLMHFNITISPDEGFWKGHPKSLASVTSVSCVPQCPEAVHPGCILLQTLHSLQEQATPSCSTLLPCILTRPNITRNFLYFHGCRLWTNFMHLHATFPGPESKMCGPQNLYGSMAAQMLSWFGIVYLFKVRRRFTIQTLICRAMLGAWSIFCFQHCKLHQGTSRYIKIHQATCLATGPWASFQVCLNILREDWKPAAAPVHSSHFRHLFSFFVPPCSSSLQVSVRARNLEHIQKKRCELSGMKPLSKETRTLLFEGLWVMLLQKERSARLAARRSVRVKGHLGRLGRLGMLHVGSAQVLSISSVVYGLLWPICLGQLWTVVFWWLCFSMFLP